MSNKKVCYYYDDEVGNYYYGCGHPMVCELTWQILSHEIETAQNSNDAQFAAQLWSLQETLRLRMSRFSSRNSLLNIQRPAKAKVNDMTRFHTDEYVKFLETVTPENMDSYAKQLIRCMSCSHSSHSFSCLDNVGEDCPVFDGLFQYCQLSAGGSMGTLASMLRLNSTLRSRSGGALQLNRKDADIAINWTGGLHHAKKSEASGFCYINDIVLAILELLKYASSPGLNKERMARREYGPCVLNFRRFLVAHY